MVVKISHITLAEELISRYDEIMQKPIRTKWHYNKVEYLAAVLHGLPTNQTASHLTKDSKDVNPKLTTPELGNDNLKRESILVSSIYKSTSHIIGAVST